VRETVVVQFEKSSKDCHSEARLSREESAGLLLAASRFLADKAGFGMTRRAFLRKLHHDPRNVRQACSAEFCYHGDSLSARDQP